MTWTNIFRSAIIAASLFFANHAGATGIIPLAGTQQFNKDASPPAYLTGGIVNIYLAGTTTPAAIFSDFALTVPLANPFTLNTAGRFPAVYVADGAYRVRVSSSTSVLQFDDDNVAAVTAAISTTPIVVTPQQLWSTGDVKVRYDDQLADGYVRANGRTIGSPTSGATERANADCEPLFKYLWTFANISVVAGKGASAAADWSANKQLTLPDMAGRLIAARDNLGNGNAGRITSATVAGPTLAGSVGGQEQLTLVTAQMPAHTHASPALTDPGHTHTINTNSVTAGVVGAGANNVMTTSLATIAAAVTGITLAATTGSTGGATPTATMPPVMLFTVYLKL